MAHLFLPPFMQRRVLLLAVLCAGMATSFVSPRPILVSTARAASCGLRPGDELSIVSTWHLGSACGRSGANFDLRVKRYDGDRGWVKSGEESLLVTADPSTITCFYLHGARVEYSTAVSRLWSMYRTLVRAVPEDRPLRLVLWAWPNSKTLRPARDFRTAASRADSDAWYLAGLLARMDPETKVSLVAYSMGPRIATGALHLLGGGSLRGTALPGDPPAGPPRMRVVLWAPSIHNDWLLPGSRHGMAVTRTDRMLTFYNTSDPVLKRYAQLDPCTRPVALGYSGLASPGRLGDERQRIEQRSAGCAVGWSHDFDRHIGSGSIVGPTRRYLLWTPLEEDESGK